MSTKKVPPSQTVQEPPGSMVWLLSDKNNNIKINVVRKHAYTSPTTSISFQEAQHFSHCSQKF
jgi:hypothetical protein